MSTRAKRLYDNEMCTSRSNRTLSSSLIPVFGRDRHLYKNLYCAKCHEVEEFEIVPFQLDCNEDKSFCKITIGREYAEKCIPYCHKKIGCRPGNEYYERYHSHAGNYKCYDNIFCFQCAEGEIKELSEPVVHIDFDCFIGEYRLPSPYSWASLLLFTDSEEKEEIKNRCPIQHIFTLLTNGCMKIRCPEGFKAFQFKCEKITSKDVGTTKRTNLTGEFQDALLSDCLVTHRFKLYVANVTDLSRFIDNVLPGNSNRNATIFRVRGTKVKEDKQRLIVEMNSITNVSIMEILSRGRLKVGDFLYRNNSILISSQLSPFYYPMKLNYSNIFMDNNICEKPLLLDTNNVSFSYPSCNAMYRGDIIKIIYMDRHQKRGVENVYLYLLVSLLFKSMSVSINKIEFNGSRNT